MVMEIPDGPYILAVDPGDTTGYAIIKFGGEVQSMGQILMEDWPAFLAPDPGQLMFVVYEDFVVFRKTAARMVGSKNKASQVIGMLKMYASQHNVPTVPQGSAILAIAEKLSGVKQPKDHSISHEIDAVNHGMYFLINRGLAPTSTGATRASKA